MRILFIIILSIAALQARAAEHPLSDCVIKPPSKYMQYYIDAAARYPNGLSLCGLVMQGWLESGFRERAISSAGARGIAQFMPETAKDMGIDPWNPRQSIMGQAKYMNQLIELWSKYHLPYQEVVALALASYNYGSSRLLRNMKKHECESWEQMTLYLPNEVVEYVETIRFADIDLRNRNAF